MSLSICTWSDLNEQARDELLRRPAVSASRDTEIAVADIIEAVRDNGDRALQSLTRRFDRAEIPSLRVSDYEFEVARDQLDDDAVAAIVLAIANGSRFHQEQVPADISVETMPGVRCERVSHPIGSVGLYVPAGTAPLPSAAIMLAVPASIAGCPNRIMCTPPRLDGSADPAVLTAASRAGIDRIYKVGGAQAIAAMAYGTDSVPKVDKIFGPGNAWVTCAKALVSADPEGVAIDMPAGPSEVLVIADAEANPEFVAADLLSQAEHGADSQVILLTTSIDLATNVQQEVDAQLSELSRSEVADAAVNNSRAIVVKDIATAVQVSNRYAPEHLILQVTGARGLLSTIRNAGSVFIGPWSPESAGDYCSGTNHVLPTYGYARTYSGLGVDQFLRQMTVQELSEEGLIGLGKTIVTLANLEGLDAHAAAVTRRLGAKS
jgi:histidinol dehydrogenase